MQNKYSLYSERIAYALINSNPIDYGGSRYIEMLCKQVFHDDFFLQIVLVGKTFHWYRTTWEKAKDRFATQRWLDEVSETHDSLTIHLRKEAGKDDIQKLQTVLNSLQHLVVKPFCDCTHRGRDGLYIWLQAGEHDQAFSFSWSTSDTPAEWDALDKLAKQLIKLNLTLPAETCTYAEASWEIEALPASYSSLTTICLATE